MRTDTKQLKPRGRPRAYDREAVIDKALKLFWRKGYSSTSLDDLVAATGVNRPSLYAGFGDKEHIYLAVLDRFREMMKTRLNNTLAQRGKSDTLAAALTRYFTELIEIYTGANNEAFGCAVFCTTVSEATNRKPIRDTLVESLNFLDAMFEGFLAEAHRNGRLRADLNVAGLARLLSAVQHSLAMRARAGQSRKELKLVAESATMPLQP